MGGICNHPTEQNVLYTTKTLPDTYSGFQSPRFYFSTQPLFKLDAQCLLIITNDPFNLHKNIAIKKMLNQGLSDRICNQYKQFIKGKKLASQQNVIFSLSVVGLDYTKVCVLYFPQNSVKEIFDQESEKIIQQKFVGCLKNCIESVKQKNITSLVITEFCWKNWIYKKVGYLELAKVIIEFKFFKAVVFSCLSQQSQILALQIVQQLKKTSA